MPYEGEFADKSAHSDLMRRPDVIDFLNQCDYLKEPSLDEARVMANMYGAAPETSEALLPDSVMAVDGSYYESALTERLPHTRIGYIKIGALVILMNVFGSLRDSRYVDPFKVAKLQHNNESMSVVLPSSNIRWGGFTTVRDGFRAALDERLGKIGQFEVGNSSTSLLSTLFVLASTRSGPLGTQDPSYLMLHRCPSCTEENVKVYNNGQPQVCPKGHRVYPSDCLRVWEGVEDFQSNREALGRAMMAIEHLLPIHYVRYLIEKSPVALANTAFFIDGPLAIFGQSAWLHGAIMKFLHQVNQRLRELSLPQVLIIGLQKTGQVVDHVTLIERFLSKNTLMAISDDYRYTYILAGRSASQNGFGSETYYGQDFIYLTPSGRTFVFGLPYPFASKQREDFASRKLNWSMYDLPRALSLIQHFEYDLFTNAVIPVALAHRYTAISAFPGGRVLDVLTKKVLEG